MALIVQKYGGTSLGSLDLIRQVAERVIQTRKREGHQVVVVLSAMAGETDRLIGMAGDISESPDPREVDVLISTGEQVSVALFCMAVRDLGFKARSLLGFQAKIITDNLYGRARIQDIDVTRIRDLLDRGNIVAVAGFQGFDERGNITTLGRGGSDTTAVALAAALEADVCEIYTDVSGVYTTDPRICEEARKLETVSYEEMLEMSSLGAKVLEIRSVEFAMKFGVPIHVRHSQTDEPGTLIVKEDEDMEHMIISGVVYNRNEARITVTKVPDKPGMAAAILSPVSNAGIIVDMIIQNTSIGSEDATDFSFSVPMNDFERAMRLVRDVAKEIGAEKVVGDDSITKISLVGVGMRNHAGVATKMFDALAKEGINILMISTSEIKISCVISDKYTELAVRAVHSAFGLDKE
ncbi:MAG: aspartate kinase [Deltaproteobacteria bacterium]|nr:aspartate kinase [Deltaproteobacteria bacterium]MBW2050947.1 aspartate kinase [Deltaproteobacteria bacterium]MBW2139618.1 aspartate kinase [Deltaproteobacteria bacterium]MBW2322270.1 aspartate kinase [Deltaproteobacteria bacterium]